MLPYKGENVSETNMRMIHEASMRILKNTGMKFVHPDAQEILKDHGIRMEGQVAFFEEGQILEWISKAPPVFEMKALNPTNDITIGGDNVVNGVTIVTKVMERDGTERSASIDDYLKLLKLYEANPKIGINGGLTVEPEEIPVLSKNLVLNLISLCHSEKVLYTAGGGYKQMEAVLELTCARYGMNAEEMKNQPVIMGLSNTNSPLMLDSEMTETILTFAKYKQPVIIASAAMSGSTAPVTIAGAIALTNAEVLSAAVLAQMYSPGAPVIYGSQSTVSDLRTGGIAIGAPESALCSKYCAALAKFYKLPCRAGGALTDAKAFDPQAAYEGMLNYYANASSKVNVILHSAGVMNGYLSMSFDKVIMDFEIIDYVDRFLADVNVNADTIPEELIHKVGHAGSYLVEKHTRKFCRIDPLMIHISARGTESDPQSFYKKIDRRIEQLLNEYKKPEIPDKLLSEMKKIVLANGISPKLIEKCI
jgi:trimethylamine--corrinoid protein Co-methyltransferase